MNINRLVKISAQWRHMALDGVIRQSFSLISRGVEVLIVLALAFLLLAVGSLLPSSHDIKFLR
jgi:hypothetical protein